MTTPDPASPGTAGDAAAAARWLRSAAAVRARSALVREAAAHDALEHFSLDPSRLPAAADYVAAVVRARHPDLRVPLHSRWRHFAVGGRDRWAALAARLPDARERARAAIDLAVTSVLLDAGAGPRWRYSEPGTGALWSRSEGLALASLELFAAGAFSSDPAQPLRADAEGLARIDAGRLGTAFQVGADNPLVGLGGRAALLARLGRALAAAPALFGTDPPRPGGLLDALAARADGGALPASAVLDAVLAGLGDIWPGRLTLAGVNLGDVWHHPLARFDDASDGLVPFHKLSQWLAYSLIEPLTDGGLDVTGLDGLTGLPEYRNGGLFVDLGVLALRDPGLAAAPLAVGSVPVVEWRALTVALLDEIAPLVRARLGLDAERMPLASVLEGGTWAAGRQVAAERRPGGPPPLAVESDGTVF